MRVLNKRWIGVGLAILFAASLFALGGSSRYSNLFNSDNFVANVSGTNISTTQFVRALDMNVSQFAQMIGSDLSAEQIKAFQIHQLVLQNLVNNAIFENEFDKISFTLDDSTIAKKTKERFPNLYINNKINDDALNSFLRQQRLKIEDLVNIINYETRASVFDELFFETNYPSEVSKIINMVNNQSRKIKLIKIPFEKITVPNLNIENINNNNEDLKNYYAANTKDYIQEERRDLSYIVIDKLLYSDKFTPNKTEIENYFSENKNLFLIPEKRSFKQFNFKSKEKAEDFRVRVKGLNQDEITTFSRENNIIFNNFENLDKNQVLEDLSNVIFSLQKDDISEVVSTAIAFHVIILDNISYEKQSLYGEVEEEIKLTLTNIQLNNFFNDLKLKINQQILNGSTLKEIANKNSLQIENLKNITLNNVEEDDLTKTLITNGFSQNKDFISDVDDFSNNKSFIINVDNIIPSEPKSLNIAFNDVKSDFLISKKTDYANKIFKENNFKNSIKNISEIFNIEYELITIEMNSDTLPTSIKNNVFDTDINNLTFSSDDKNIYFAQVDSILIPDINEEFSKISLISEIKNAFGNEIIKTKNISFNDELINGLLSQYK
ncbi:SurA N-terminal domain-containing protein [Pelagibacteraceae bacterium]|nr:SurA N-terminal domain-containing protein [Pelagibacteraceae bacterium]